MSGVIRKLYLKGIWLKDTTLPSNLHESKREY